MLKETIEPRLYQQTIFNTAAMHNTLVVLPTGMGKTMIAAMMASHRLQQYPKTKILFLAPTRPLVQQHKTTFERDMKIDDSQTALFTGSISPKKRQELWEQKQFIFSTPQGLENDIVSSRISLKEVSLLILDEAHRATGDYAYVFIADQYKKQANHERILALTASPGDTKETVEEVCKNLGIEELEVRSQDSPDVKPYVQEIDIDYVKVPLPEEFKSVHSDLKKCYDRRIEELLLIGSVNRQATYNKTLLLKAQAMLHAKAARGYRDFDAMKSMSVLAQALKIQHAIELLETQGIASLNKYFTKLQSEAARGQSKAVKNVVEDIQFKQALIKLNTLHDNGVEHPKLKALKKIALKETYANKDTKIIIFNQYRDQAVEIKRAMDLINVSAKIFVGQMKKGDTGMSQKEQHKILEEFRRGEFSCLIATSVAEEGLDIPKVDTVIFYEPIPSAIRTVQRRGRTGRQDKGRMIMLIAEGTRDVAYRFAAQNKEKRMYRVLAEVKRDFIAEPREEQQILPQEKPTIIADHREKTSHVLKQLLDQPVTLDLQQLEVGDYLLSDRVVVEYKTVGDFVDSIVDGRLLNQLRSLRKYTRPLLVIEGDADIYSVRKVHPNAILGMLSAITVSYNIPLLFTKDSAETASLFVTIAKREFEQKRAEPQYHQSKPLTDKETQEYIIASLPGVGSQLAKQLLKHFGSVKNIIDASIDDLKAVDKVGEKKAKAIYDILRKEYRQ